VTEPRPESPRESPRESRRERARRRREAIADPEVVVYDPDDPENPERHKSPRRGMCAAVLFLEAIALGLVTPVLIQLTDVSVTTAVVIGVGLCVACLLLSGLLRKEWAYTASWVLQVLVIATGFLVSAMFFLGVVFAALWAGADLLGRKIDRERTAAWAAYDASRADG